MGGTGLLAGGRPRRGHTVECSSSRVTYCYTVLSPVKSTYIHMHRSHAGNTPLTCDVYEVHESQKKLEAVAGEQKAAKSMWRSLESWLCFASIWNRQVSLTNI